LVGVAQARGMTTAASALTTSPAIFNGKARPSREITETIRALTTRQISGVAISLTTALQKGLTHGAGGTMLVHTLLAAASPPNLLRLSSVLTLSSSEVVPWKQWIRLLSAWLV
jgi:hypothetical protein